MPSSIITSLRRPDRIMVSGALALFVCMFFFKWYGFSTSLSNVGGVNLQASASYDGWHAFTVSRWIWLLTIIVALAVVALRAGWLTLELPLPPAVVVTAAGCLSSALVVYRILDHPAVSANFAGVHASVGIKLGIWLGLLAAAAITYGGYLAMQEAAIPVSGPYEPGGPASAPPPATPV
jgi:hypothetical protein